MGRALRLRGVQGASAVSIVMAVLLFLAMPGRCGLAQAAGGASVDTRTAAVDRILADYREDESKREPEAASLAGEKRYDDQLSDLSAAAANARLSRGQTYLQRLSAIDTAGLPEKTRVAAEGLLNRLIEEQQGDRAATWRRPLEQFMRLHTQLLAIAEKLPFENAKDYDDYAARLKKIPYALSQIMTNIQLGVETGHPLPRQSVDAAMAQVQAVTGQPAEACAFMAPLKRLPAAVTAEDRKRVTTDVLDAISSDVIPAYQRFGRFVAANSAPKTTSSAPLQPAP